MIRAETVGIHPAFISMIRELILERIEPGREKRFLGALGPVMDTCAVGCCTR
jgi:ferrochelatase